MSQLLRVLAAAIVLFGAWCATVSISVATPSFAAARAYAIGDSVMLGAAPELQSLGITVDAVVSRQFVTGIGIAQSLNAAGQLPATVIIGLGTNGPFTAGQFDEMMQALHGVHLVYFLTVKEPRFWEGQVNATLHAGVARWSNARLIDWYSAASAHPAWLYTDGIHLNPSGAVGYGQLVASALGAGATPPSPAPSNIPARDCVTQSSSWHLPGVIARGVNLHGMAADQATGHLFVLSSVPSEPVGSHACVSNLLTLDLKSGRVIHSTPLGTDMPPSYHSLVVDHPAHRLLLVDTGGLSPEGARLPGSVQFFDTRTGQSVKSVEVGARPSSILIDSHGYRAYVLLNGAGGTSVVALAITRGVVLHTVTQPVQKMSLDTHTGRLFLLTPTSATTLNAATGAIVNAIALPSLPAALISDALDTSSGRLFVAQIDKQAPEVSSITVLDATTGAVVRTITTSATATVGKLLADEPEGEILSWGTGTSSNTATVIDAHSGAVRGQIQLPLPASGFRGPTAVDTHTGDIYGFTSAGVRAIRPGVTVPIKSFSAPSGTAVGLVMSGSTRRLYALLRRTGAGVRQISVIGYCTSGSCP